MREFRHGADALRIGALTPFTTVDFPDRLAVILHVQGCPLACPYCHAAHLRPPGKGTIPWAEITRFLESRHSLLDGVVITGGEPCAQNALSAALSACRAQGYATALHTSGLYPEALTSVLADLDWIGLDWKSPPGTTGKATGRNNLGKRFARSLDLVLRSGIAHEIRTTWHPSLLSGADMMAMARHLARAGAKTWMIQTYRSPGSSSAQGAFAKTVRAFPSRLLHDLRSILPGVALRMPL